MKPPRPPAPGRRAWLSAGGAWCLLAAACLQAQAAWAELPQVVAAARPAVLAVGSFNATASPRFGFRGSGFAVADGTLVVTSFHVLPEAPQGGTAPRLMVLVPQGRDAPQPRNAVLLATDTAHDLALLKMEGPPVPPLVLAPGSDAREGQSIALMGYPIAGALGFSVVTHRGIVSAITRIALPAARADQLSSSAVARLREGAFEVLQLDATAYPGNSGGPLLSADNGQVLGVMNMVLIKGTRESALASPTGISYAIPVQFVHALLAQPR